MNAVSKKAALGDLCQFRGGGTPSKAVNRYWRGSIPWVSPKDMKSDVVSDSMDHISPEAIEGSAASLIPKGSVLIVVRSGILARTVPLAIAGAEVSINQDLKALCPDKTLDSKFLFYFLHSRMADLLALVSRGATVHRLITDQIRSLEISVPLLVEQKRIVAILDEALEATDNAAANSTRNLENAKALFDRYLDDQFSGMRTGWVVKRLGNVVSRLTNGYVGPTRNIYYDSGVPYLLARHVKNNTLTFDGKTYVSYLFNKKNSKSILKKGDVLLVQSGHIGHSAVVPAEHDGHNCHAMIVITPAAGILHGDFLSWYFSAPCTRREFLRIRTGSTIPHLNCGDVIEMQVPVPPMEQQRKMADQIADYRSNTLRLGEVVKRKLSAIARLRTSLLNSAFTGDL